MIGTSQITTIGTWTSIHIEAMTTENSDGVLDVASLADENNEAITDLADYIAEIESRVEALEG